MSVSQRLRDILKIKSMKIKEFSELTGIPYSSSQSYLNGTRDPGMDALTVICLQLYVNINWLLTGQGEMFIGEAADTLSREEASLVDDFRHMNEQGKAAVTTTARAMAEQELFKNRKVG